MCEQMRSVSSATLARRKEIFRVFRAATTHIQERERLGETLAIGNLHQLDSVQRREVTDGDSDLSRAVVREDDDIVRAVRACAR